MSYSGTERFGGTGVGVEGTVDKYISSKGDHCEKDNAFQMTISVCWNKLL